MSRSLPGTINKWFICMAGFTLIEILIALTIMGIVLMIVVPVFNSVLSTLMLNSAANQLAADIRLQQQRAISGDTDAVTYYILFDPEQEIYYLSAGVNTLKTVTLPAGVDLLGTNFSNNRLAFNLKGIPLPGGHVTLQQSRSRNRYVIISSVIGRVRVDTVPPS